MQKTIHIQALKIRDCGTDQWIRSNLALNRSSQPFPWHCQGYAPRDYETVTATTTAAAADSAAFPTSASIVKPLALAVEPDQTHPFQVATSLDLSITALWSPRSAITFGVGLAIATLGFLKTCQRGLYQKSKDTTQIREKDDNEILDTARNNTDSEGSEAAED